MSIGSKLSELMDERELSMSELARLSGVSTASISRYASDKVSMPISAAKKLAAVLDVTLDELAGCNEAIAQTPLPDLTADERELLRMFRLMDESQQAAFLAVAPTFVTASEKDSLENDGEMDAEDRNRRTA